MDTEEETFGRNPALLQRACGGWLAVSDSNDPLQIGVAAPTRDQAEALFTTSHTRWTSLLAMREPAQP